MWATAQINPDWVGKVEYESSKKLTNGVGVNAGDDGAEKNTTRIYVEGTLFGAKATFGKFDPFAAYGFVMDDSMTGAQFQFGNVLKARVGYGKYAGTINASLAPNPGYTFAAAPTYSFGELDYSTSKVTNVKAVYHNLSNFSGTDTTALGQSSVHYTELGFDTKLADDWGIMATYAKSNLTAPVNNDNKGYLAQLTYKTADVKKEGSFDIYTNYRKAPVASQIDSTWDYNKGVKGWTIGFDYVPATNIKVNAFYLAGKNILDTATTTTNVDAKIYRAQVEFFF